MSALLATRRLVVTGLIFGLASLPSSLAATPIMHRIVIAKMAFGDSPPNIRAGDTIEWVNEDLFLHSVTAADKSFDIDIQPNKSARFVVRAAGIIRYSCKYHPGMQAQLIVGDSRQ